MSVCIGCGHPFNGNHPEQHCRVPSTEVVEKRNLDMERSFREAALRRKAALYRVYRFPGEVGFTEMLGLANIAMSPHFLPHEQTVAKLQFDAWERNT